MAKAPDVTTPEINRLRAAAALIPLIEAGLADSKLSIQRASPMVTFCEWATKNLSDAPHVARLAKTIETGLERLKMTLAAVES